MTAAPRRAPGARLLRTDDGGCLLQLGDDRSIALDETSAALWELCDGRTSVEEMVEASLELFAGDAAQIEADIRGVLARLRALGALVPSAAPVASGGESR